MDPKTPTLWPATTTNCVVLGCGDVLLVDPATPYPQERAAFDELLAVTLEGRRVQGIVLTHHHLDHVGDAERLRALHGCPVYAHALTADQRLASLEQHALLLVVRTAGRFPRVRQVPQCAPAVV